MVESKQITHRLVHKGYLLNLDLCSFIEINLLDMPIGAISSIKESFHNSDFFNKKFREDIVSTFSLSLITLIVFLGMGYTELKLIIIPAYAIICYGLGYWMDLRGNRMLALIFCNIPSLIVPYISIVFPEVRLESLILVSFAISGLIYNDTQKWIRNSFSFYLIAFLLLQAYESWMYWNVPVNPEYMGVNLIVLGAGVLSIILSIFVFAQTFSHFISELLKQEELLIVAKNKFQDLFDNNHDAIIIYNAQKEDIEHFNDRFRELFRYDSKQVNKPELLSITSAAKQHELNLKEQVGAFLLDAEQGTATLRFEHIFKRLDGEEFEGETTLIAHKTDPDRVIILVRDISLSKRQERLINRQVDDLSIKNSELHKYIESNLQLENFAYIASHDLKAPMRTIVSFSQLLKRNLKGEIGEREKEYLDFIISGTKNLETLINDILTFSRVNTTQRAIEPVKVKDLLNETIIGLKSSIDEKKARICIGDLPSTIDADRMKFKLLLLNFLTNSLKFVDSDKIPEIQIKGEEKPDHWRFSIKDNGIGIDPEFEEKIFLLFKRLHNQQEYDGTGIGLALCKKLVEQHEGEIRLYSEPGYGSEFIFTIKKGLS